MATFSPRIGRQDGSLPMQISEELTRNAKMIGFIEGGLDLNRLQDDSDESFIYNAHKVLSLAERTNHVVQSLQDIEWKMNGQDFTGIDELARNILIHQFQSVQRNSIELKQRVDLRLDESLWNCEQKLYAIRDRCVDSIAAYLTTRQPQDLLDARQNQGGYHAIQRTLRDFLHALKRNPDRQEPIEEAAMRLIDVWPSEEPVEFALQKLESAIADAAAKDQCASIHTDEYNKEKIEQSIAWIDGKLGYDAVNYWVWKLAGEQPGENWGLVHRYDDLDILKNAILKASQSVVEKMFKEEGEGLEHERILIKCYENLGKPRLDDPIKWMQENISRYPTTLSNAIGQIRFQEREFEELRLNDSFEIMSVSSPRNDSAAKKATTQAANVLLQLQFLIETDGKISEELKREVEGLIQFLADRGQLDTINWQVWQLSKALDKSGENWGAVHRYDDPKVLFEALKIAIQNDVHDTVCKEFSDPEDQNAVYLAMGIRGIGDSDLPALSLVERVRADIHLYLHLVDTSIDHVKWTQELRRHQLELESRNALEELVRAAIEKNPEAKVISQLLDLIKARDDLSSKKTRIQEVVEGPDFDKGLQQQIFSGIWHMAGEPQGNPNFGKENYLIDLDRLEQVLVNILVEISVE